MCLEDSILEILEKDDFKPKIKTAFVQLMNLINKWRKDSKNMKHFEFKKKHFVLYGQTYVTS